MAVRSTRPTARRRNRRRWRAATALTPTLLLVAASSTLLSLPPPTVRDGRAESSPDGGGLYGASGHLPQTEEPGEHLLDLVGRPQRMPGPPDDAPRGRLDIPEPMMAAYVGAADRLAGSHPGCRVHWSVLASIGRIESGHARGGNIDVNGTTAAAILGPRLSGGPGVAAIPDTDGGSLDGDPVWDRAVGAMQFIPATWNKYAIDGNDDGELSPHNVHDAAATSGAYLCDGDADLREPRALAEAVFRYNHSDDYVRTVLRWADAYAGGAFPLPVEPLPEVDDRDVLAGSRLPAARPEEPVAASPEDFDSGASALTPPSPAAAPPEPAGDVRPTWPGASGGSVNDEPVPGADAVRPPEAAGSEVAPPPDADPALPPGSEAPDVSSSQQPAHEGTSSAERPPSSDAPPASDAPPSTSVPPQSGPPASEAPPSSSAPEPSGSATTPPGSQQPESSGSQPVPPASTDSAKPPSEAAPSSEPAGTPTASEPPASSVSPAPEPSGHGATSTEPSTPTTSETGSPVPSRCAATDLDEGRFVPREQAESAGARLEPGTTDPHAAVPGEVVFVESAASGPLEPCEVPAEFKPAS
ncbi:lytic transglycosylase domain-containing protein [Saccharopolyspora gloriosae]|uniref:lytic transglycosylase domain-containing protein n=1 Tax=Saccharopolyspora gloriosae TaxID=455344 RepID=UPI001FB7B275|nr:lytic transglycosylase domain-containing protein [Saccharopolyspora gloriosae]